MDKKNYSRGVGMIIINNDGRFWLGKRIGTEAWQFPQGGIDKGEDSLKAAIRELKEETSGINVELIKEAIAKGDYPVDLDKVADALLQAYQDIK